MSGDFTQRGRPALVDKFARSEMALRAGADLVIELPFLFACSAGRDFARGAVDVLGGLGVGSIVFGMENPDFEFMPLVREMVCESEGYSEALREELSRGASYSKAHALALERVIPGSLDFITRPNNMLAVSYMAEVARRGLGIEAVPFKREEGIRSRDIRSELRGRLEGLAGGSGCAGSEQDGKGTAGSVHEGRAGRLHDMLNVMPETTIEIFTSSEREGRVSDESKLWPLLQGVFIRSRAEDLRKIYAIDEGIEGLMLKHWRKARGLDDFIGRCVCARYTRAHIMRRLIYILLGLDRWEVLGAMREGVPYARVLGFNQRGRELLRNYSGNLRVITRLSEARTKRERYFADIEFKASQLYELLMNKPDMSREGHTVLKFP